MILFRILLISLTKLMQVNFMLQQSLGSLMSGHPFHLLQLYQ